jgi:RNA 2',3'-cyclic 3'-phosphodiesterase
MSSGERVRLFVALELPGDIRGALARWRPSMSGLRLVDAGDLHVTLCFLGWRFEPEIQPILDACSTLSSLPAAALSLDHPLWLPPRRPRVLAVRLSDSGERLAEVQSELSRALAEGGWYVPEVRPFLAHVTVARIGRDVRRAPAVELAPPPLLSFAGTRVTLYRSRLDARGARYEALGSVTLGSGAAAPADPVSVVRRFHAEQGRAYALGEMDGVAELLCDDVVWHVPGESAIAGEHRGRQAVLDYFARRRGLTDATFRVTVHGAALIDGRVVQLAGGRALREGQEVSWETVGVFTVRNGRIAECWLVPFDQREFDRIWS